ncbi:MAG: 3-isopropylmalate dehydratase large subunit [Clostridia bacterium]
MGMTMTQKILAAHAGLEKVEVGQLIMANVDLVLGNDITAPVAINEFEKIGVDKVFDRTKIALIPDHFTPCKDIQSAEQVNVLRKFARKHDIVHFYEMGRVGVEHALIPEIGLAVPGDLIIGADSHTCTYGALGAFSTGVGSTDMAAAMATGKAWFKVPAAIKFNLTGTFNKYVSGKDLILYIIGKIGVDGARYMSMEFVGDGVSAMTVDDRLAAANMAIEAGGKNGIFEVDEQTLEYVKEHSTRSYTVFAPDSDAEYAMEMDIDLSTLEQQVAFPHLPSNTRTISNVGNVKIDQVVIGSCTNGRLSDMREAADILKGRTIHPDVRCIVIPATQKIWQEAMNEGLFDIFVNAGAVVSTPTCGPCLGGHMGILAKGERAVATTNRNFVGRMGHVESEVYLSNPAVAAASAVLGRIAGPDELEGGR